MTTTHQQPSGKKGSIATLIQWEARLQKSQIGHYAVSERYSKVSIWLKVPLVVVSAVASTTVIASFYEPTPQWVNYLAGSLSIIATVLAALHSATRADDISNSHERVASKYGTIRRSIETFLANADEDEDAVKFLHEIERRWDIVAEDAPVTPTWARRKANLREQH